MKKLAALLIIILLSLYLLLTTQGGLTLAKTCVNRLFKENLHIHTAQGSLLSSFTLYGVHLQNEYIDLTLHDITITWSPLKSIFSAKLIINDLLMHDAHLQLKKLYFSSAGSNNKLRFINTDIQQMILMSSTISWQDHIQHINQFSTDHQNFILDLPEGNIQGRYNLDLSHGLAWQLELVAPRITFKNQGGYLSFHLTSDGLLSQKEKNIAKITIDQLAGVYLNQPLSGHLMAQTDLNKSTANLDFNLGNNQAKLDATHQNDQAFVNFNVSIPSLSSFSPHYTGSIIANGNGFKNNDQVGLNAVFSINNLSMEKININHVAGRIFTAAPQKQINLTANLTNARVQSYLIKTSLLNATLDLSKPVPLYRFNLILSPQNRLEGTFSQPNSTSLFDAQKNIAATIHFFVQKPSDFFAMDSVSQMAGNIAGTLTLTGKINNPVIRSSATLTNGTARINRLGIQLTNINLTGTANNSRTLSLRGQFRSGRGLGQIESQLDLTHLFPLQIKLNGNALQLMNLPHYQVALSPALNININQNLIDITGNATIPFFKIVLDNFDSVVRLPSDVVIAGQKAPAALFPNRLALNLNVTLTKNNVFAYQNLYASSSGQLRITQIPGSRPTATGTLFINQGLYYLYNQVLTIEKGRLIYLGNTLTNPGLDLRALRRTSQATHRYVGASIRGTLNHPDIRLISNPPMSQNDILAQLVFGSSVNQLASGGGLQALGTIASHINLVNPNIGDTEDENYQTQSTSPISKFASLNPLQGLNFQQDLGTNWFIQTQTGFTETSIDLMYSYRTN